MYKSVPLPGSWEKKAYNNKPYYLVEVFSDSSEYAEIENHFDNYTILKIERVQNPYQYGKFLLYKLQKDSPSEVTMYMPLRNSTQLEKALRFNCDYRQLDHTGDFFFSTVSAAAMHTCSHNQLIILKCLSSYKSHDSGRYPSHVVTYEKN